jgi:uncharacterized protein
MANEFSMRDSHMKPRVNFVGRDIFILFWTLCAVAIVHAQEVADVTDTVSGIHITSSSTSARIRSWLERQSEGVVLQQYQLSCGAASIATLMTYLLEQPVTEKEVMAVIQKDNEHATSMQEIVDTLKKIGLSAGAYSGSYDALLALDKPAILYLRSRKSIRDLGHFVVLFAAAEDAVWIKDPYFGNRILPRTEFVDLWYTRDDARNPGRIVIVESTHASSLIVAARMHINTGQRLHLHYNPDFQSSIIPSGR